MMLKYLWFAYEAFCLSTCVLFVSAGVASALRALYERQAGSFLASALFTYFLARLTMIYVDEASIAWEEMRNHDA